jgi:hypothetical protein
MPIIQKANGAITQEFLKAAGSNMKGFLKATVQISPLYCSQQLSETRSYCY